LDVTEKRPYKPKLSTHSSRDVVDKIMREGEELIPVHSRAEYQILCEDKVSGKQYRKKASNSDVLFYNQFYWNLKSKLYTP